MPVSRSHARSLVGKPIYAVRKDGSVVIGKLVAIKGSQLMMEKSKGKQVQTKLFLPLALFDIAAIGTLPYGGYGYGYGYGGYGGYDGWW
ncbi:MAG: hypothetical protein P0Y55_03335 [Candidatus Cohnella colombiensis]|uniref:50S ribosomal protein L33 n=1 Tax=Candidatus Cohnella colombiensis TaxID=3121368 RepID=A0AA95EY97_9BACL|nr:MAG: hypothetical protein P0Y55_03335 [Cohnella sp.]